MARRDLAQSNLSIMQRNDEDSILCQLASAWVSISTGSSTCEQALYNLQTLSEQVRSKGRSLNHKNSVVIPLQAGDAPSHTFVPFSHFATYSVCFGGGGSTARQ